MVNETKQQAIETLNEMLQEYGLSPLNDNEIQDWGIAGGETNAQLQEWVNDYVSDIHSEECEGENAWRYEY